MPSSPLPVIVIPAWNEAKNIGLTIQLIKLTNIPCKVIVVDDGSKDKTAEVAKKSGATVLRLEKNSGKAAAIFIGFQRAIKTRTEAIIMLDADMRAVPHYGLSELIRRATIFTRLGKSKMVISHVSESVEYEEGDFTSSGIRSFSRAAVNKLLKYPKKGEVKGYGLETFLNALFGREREVFSEGGFIAHEAFRKGQAKQDAQEFREFDRSWGLADKNRIPSPRKPTQRPPRRP